MHVKVTDHDTRTRLLTVVYASPHDMERAETWRNIRTLSTTINEPWLLVGDFNEISSTTEQKGGAPPDQQRCLAFSKWINDCNLVEVSTVGTKYTWRGPKWDGRARVFKRLDRVL